MFKDAYAIARQFTLPIASRLAKGCTHITCKGCGEASAERADGFQRHDTAAEGLQFLASLNKHS
jgi:hypothetical protein